MKDLHSNIKPVSLLDPIAVTATGNSGDIDLAGFSSCELVIVAGVDTGLDADNKVVFSLTHADDDGTGSADSYANIATADVLGVTPASGVVVTIDATTEDNTLYRLGYVGDKRFAKLTWTVTGTVSLPLCVMAIKGNPLDAPTE